MMTKKKFGWRGGRGHGNPQSIGEELERLRKEKGELTSEGVVESASKETSPLHDCFNWDDTEAAHKFRLIQARTLIRKVVVIIPDKVPTTHYVHVQSESKAGNYVPMEIAVQSEDLYTKALTELQSKLSAATAAVHELKEAAGKSKIRGKVAIINIVVKALQTASDAMTKLSV